MAKYQTTERENGQGIFVVVDMRKQLIQGTLEWGINEIVEKKLDMSTFDSEYKNDIEGRPAINPRGLLKLVFYGYSKGLLSSRRLEALSRENIIAQALCGADGADHGTIAAFVSGHSEIIKKIFVEVLMVCDEMGLVGKEMFAIDGCRLPSNAAKEWSGTIDKLKKKASRFEKRAEQLVSRHNQNDASDIKGKTKANDTESEREKKAAEKLMKKADYIKNFLKETKGKKKTGESGKEVQSNVTDNESAKIKGPHGVIQGYNGIAVADSKAQVIVASEAFGTDYEGGAFEDMLTNLESNMKAVSGKENPAEQSLLLADTNYFCELNLQAAKDKNIDVIIPDNNFRQRDERFNDRKENKEGNKTDGSGETAKDKFTIDDFKYSDDGNSYTCPNGKILLYRGKSKLRHGRKVSRYSVKEGECCGCPLIERCIKLKDKSRQENARKTIIYDRESLSAKMRKRIDSKEGQSLYSHRAQIIEPCFADIEYCKGMNRFTLRGKLKVNAQWLLYCIVHNIGKCVPKMTELFA